MTQVPHEFYTPKHEQLFWAEHHAKDQTIAQHNREHFAREAARLRGEIASELTPAKKAWREGKSDEPLIYVPAQ